MTDNYIDRQIADMSQAHDPAGPWENRRAFQSLTIATGTDHTNSVKRSTVADGNVVRTEVGNTFLGSTQKAFSDQNSALRLPFDYAVDEQTKCRISPYELKESSVLYFGGESMTVAQARMAGYLPPGWQRPGSYSHGPSEQSAGTAPGNGPTRQEAAQLPSELQAEAFSNRAADETLSSLVNNSGGVEQMAAVQEVIETGAIDARTLGTLATQLAIEPEALNQQFAPVMAEFERQGREVFAKGGLDADEVISWSQENRPDALKLAMRHHATQRSTRGYSALRNEYLVNLGESNPERALSADLGAGITSYRDPKGQVVVRLSNGETMLWKTAIKAFGPK